MNTFRSGARDKRKINSPPDFGTFPENLMARSSTIASEPMSDPAPFLIDEADAPALRNAVSSIGQGGYSEAAVCERLGLNAITDLHWHNLPIYRGERLTQRDTLDLAIDLFLLQGSLARDEADRLLRASSRDVLLKTGLLETDEAGLTRARASLFPVGAQLIFSDHAWPELPHPGCAAVPYHTRSDGDRPGQPPFGACHYIPRAGCPPRSISVPALAFTRCWPPDTRSMSPPWISIRARYNCTRFNAQAMGVANLEAVEGDLFGPVHGKRFDLITANPPFVPSPLNTLRFRDGGASGEDIQKRIVAGLPQHLAPSGIAQMVTELGERDGEPITGRLREWLAGAAMDIYVLRVGTHTAAQYAVGHAKGHDYSAFLSSTEDWARNLRAQGYARVVAVLVVFQWSSAGCGGPWERMEEARPPQRSAGAEIEAAFHAERLARNPDLRGYLDGKWLRRPGPIARFDASVLGGAIPPQGQSHQRLGQALSIEHEGWTRSRTADSEWHGGARVAASELLRQDGEFDSLDAIRSLLEETPCLDRRRVDGQAGFHAPSCGL